ncbi:MAG: hypothetical protein ACPGVG_08950 [Mycobacterium sp.]
MLPSILQLFCGKDSGGALELSPVPDWLQVVEAIGQGFGVPAVIVALIALVWQLHKDRADRDERDKQNVEDRNRHEAQIAALRQAEDDRLAAQARLIIPGTYRGYAFSSTLWNLRIDNASMGAISGLQVTVIIKDADGNDVPHGYRLANTASVGQAMAAFILPEFSHALDGMQTRFNQFIAYIRDNVATLAENPEQMAAIQEQFTASISPFAMTSEVEANIKAQINQAIQMQFTNDWDPILYASRFLAMAIETTRADYTPHLHIRYQDSAGYVWERTDTEGPRRISQQVEVASSPAGGAPR